MRKDICPDPQGERQAAQPLKVKAGEITHLKIGLNSKLPFREQQLHPRRRLDPQPWKAGSGEYQSHRLTKILTLKPVEITQPHLWTQKRSWARTIANKKNWRRSAGPQEENQLGTILNQ